MKLLKLLLSLALAASAAVGAENDITGIKQKTAANQPQDREITGVVANEVLATNASGKLISSGTPILTSITGPAATDLTLAGGSSGASFLLGQGTNGKSTILLRHGGTATPPAEPLDIRFDQTAAQATNIYAVRTSNNLAQPGTTENIPWANGAVLNEVNTESTNAHSYSTRQTGTYSYINHHGSGQMDNPIGSWSVIASRGSGGMGLARAYDADMFSEDIFGVGNVTSFVYYHARPARKGAGTVGAVYGVYIDEQTVGTSNYGIYTNGATPNYFGTGGNRIAVITGPTTAGDFTASALTATGAFIGNLGGTFNNNLAVARTGAVDTAVDVISDSGRSAALTFRDGVGVRRWTTSKTSAANFRISAYDATDTAVDNPIDIPNAESGIMNLSRTVSLGGGAATRELRFMEASANGSGYVGFKAPDALSGGSTFIWPSDTPIAGDALTWNAGDQLSWTPAGGGSGDVTAAAAFGTDNLIIRSDGTGKGTQSSLASLDDIGVLTAPHIIATTSLNATAANLYIGTDARATSAAANINTAAGQIRALQIDTGGVARWQFGGSTDAESGSNEGTDIFLRSFDDAGALIGNVFTAGRLATDPLVFDRPVVADSFSGDGANLTSLAASNITGPFGDISMTGTLTREGAQILTATTSGGTVIDTSKARSERTITADTTFTFSAAPPTGSQFSVALTADTVDRAITIPSSYSFEAGGAVTVFTQRANQHLLLGFIRLASSYQVIGVPVSDILGSTITLAEGGSTATPAAATSKVYVKADGLWYGKDDAGVETALSNVAGGGAPTTATYITQTADAGLSAEQAMGALATGIVKNTTTTGVQSIAVAGTDYAGLASANAFTAAQGITLVNAQTQTNTITGMGTTPVPGLQVTNTTAAAAGAQQVSPSIRWTGQGWKTDATAASRSVEFRSYVLPIQSTANPTGNWMLETSINGGAWGPVLTIGSVGAITMASGQTITAGNLDVGATGFMEWVGRSYMQSPADGQIVMKNQAGTAMLLQLAGTTASFPGIARATEYVNIVDATGGTTGGLQINSGTPLLGLLSASAAIDFASMLTGAEDTQTITVTGVATTNTPSVELGWSASLEAGISVSQAWVSGANTVSIRVRNNTVGTVDPASVTVRATVASF